jgi:hypothetical protein
VLESCHLNDLQIDRERQILCYGLQRKVHLDSWLTP